jgi:hypothetical protein
MVRTYIPTRTAENWRQSLAAPDTQWQTGYSAKTLACCWQDADGFPACVRKAFLNSGTAIFRHIEPLLIIPGHEASLPGGAPDARNDIFILARSVSQLVSITVEGKVDEPFGRRVSEWLQAPSADKQEHLEFLCSELNVPAESFHDIPSRLLHRTVSAKLLARPFQAGSALMMVHSFSSKDAGFDQYAQFAALFGIKAEKNMIQPALRFDGLVLYLGWVKGNQAYLGQ